MIERGWEHVIGQLPNGVLAITKAGGECPVPVEGLLTDRRPFYFRGRGENVDLWIGEAGTPPPALATETGFRWHGALEEWEGDEDAGRLSPREALAALERLVARHTEGAEDDGEG